MYDTVTSNLIFSQTILLSLKFLDQ